MRRIQFFKIIFSLLLLCCVSSVFAWTHGLSIGYGGGADPNHTAYNNSGEFLSAEILSIKNNKWFNVTFNGSLGNFESSAPVNKNLFTAALSIAARLYIWGNATIHPFLLGSEGPAYLSHRKFGYNNQAANVAFQSILGAGFEFGRSKRIDANIRFVHYSSGYTMVPNQGFNIFYIGSLGYLF